MILKASYLLRDCENFAEGSFTALLSNVEAVITMQRYSELHTKSPDQQ